MKNRLTRSSAVVLIAALVLAPMGGCQVIEEGQPTFSTGESALTAAMVDAALIDQCETKDVTATAKCGADFMPGVSGCCRWRMCEIEQNIDIGITGLQLAIGSATVSMVSLTVAIYTWWTVGGGIAGVLVAAASAALAIGALLNSEESLLDAVGMFPLINGNDSCGLDSGDPDLCAKLREWMDRLSENIDDLDSIKSGLDSILEDLGSIVTDPDIGAAAATQLATTIATLIGLRNGVTSLRDKLTGWRAALSSAATSNGCNLGDGGDGGDDDGGWDPSLCGPEAQWDGDCGYQWRCDGGRSCGYECGKCWDEWNGVSAGDVIQPPPPPPLPPPDQSGCAGTAYRINDTTCRCVEAELEYDYPC